MRNSLSLLFAIVAFSAQCFASEQPQRLYVGTPIAEEDALAKGRSVLPDGSGLPSGRGTAQQGLKIYADKCAGCHGDRGEGRADFSALVGGRGSLSTDKPVLTVGSYWPTSTTLFDYIWRGMPYGAPGTLTADETYALTAWILSANGIVKETTVMDRKSLIRVKMPNADGFIVDEKIMRPSK
jgi:S-disulfanyl-L-cysteine oxidoreductase SoxD